MAARRIVLGVVGALVVLGGAVWLVLTVPVGALLRVGIWVVAAVIVHDLVLSPVLLGLGAVLVRVPARARRYLQGGLVVAGSLLVLAVPMIYVRGNQPDSKAILLQDVGAHLGLLLGAVAACGSLAWAVRVLRDRNAAHGEGTGRR
jgi:hypothetical protein